MAQTESGLVLPSAALQAASPATSEGDSTALATQPSTNAATVAMLNTQIAQLRHTNSELSKRLHVALVSVAKCCGICVCNCSQAWSCESVERALNHRKTPKKHMHPAHLYKGIKQHYRRKLKRSEFNTYRPEPSSLKPRLPKLRPLLQMHPRMR